MPMHPRISLLSVLPFTPNTLRSGLGLMSHNKEEESGVKVVALKMGQSVPKGGGGEF